MALVTLENVDPLKRDGVVNIDGVLDGGHEEGTAVAEQADPALSHRELMEQAHVVDEDVEETDLVSEARGNVETIRMDGNAVDVFGEFLDKFHVEVKIVPDKPTPTIVNGVVNPLEVSY